MRPSLAISLGSVAVPLMAGAASAADPASTASITAGMPIWLQAIILIATPGCTWAIGSAAIVTVKVATTWLRANAAAGVAKAKATKDPSDDAPAEIRSKMLNEAADVLEKRARIMLPGADRD